MNHSLELRSPNGAYWTCAEAICWIAYRSAAEMSKVTNDKKDKPGLILMKLAMSKPIFSLPERNQELEVELFAKHYEMRDFNNASEYPFVALQKALWEGKISVWAQREVNSYVEQISKAELASLRLIETGGVPNVVLTEDPNQRPRFIHPRFSTDEIIDVWPDSSLSTTGLTDKMCSAGVDIADWVYATAIQLCPNSPGTMPKSELYGLYNAKFGASARERLFNDAYSLVFDTKRGAPPRNGWPLKLPYASKAANVT